MTDDELSGAVPADDEEGVWEVAEGTPRRLGPGAPQWREGVSDLSYSNPFRQKMERVWFDGRIVFAVELGELDLDLDRAKVAQEYQVVYDVELDDDGRLVREPDRVASQYNIYDSVPGMERYSPLWQFNYVIVPRDYRPNTLRSERDCLESGYAVRKSTVVEN